MNLAHFLLFLRFLFYVNRYFTRSCVCAPCVCLITSNPMELEIRTVVSYNMDASHLEKQSALLPTALSLQPSFLLFICVHVSVYVYVCGGHRHFCFFQGLSLISPIWLNWSACLCLSSTRIPWACHHTWLFIISLMRCELIYSYLQGK